MVGIDEVSSALAQLDASPEDMALVVHVQALLQDVDEATLDKLADNHLGELASGRVINERVLELRPQDDTAMSRLANLYSLHLEPQEARRWAHSALSVNPHNTAALYAELMSYFLPRDAKQKEDVALRLLKLTPENVQVRVELALALYVQDRKADAISVLDDAPASLPERGADRIRRVRDAVRAGTEFGRLQML